MILRMNMLFDKAVQRLGGSSPNLTGNLLFATSLGIVYHIRRRKTEQQQRLTLTTGTSHTIPKKSSIYTRTGDNGTSMVNI